MHPFVTIWGKQIPTYSVFLYLGIAAGIILAVLRSKKYHIDREETFYFSLISIIGAMIGAKVLYFIVELPTLIAHPALFKYALTGGFVFYGGFIGGIAAAIIYTRAYKLPIWDFADLSAPSITLGHSLGRMGCFMAGCCYGAPTQSSWGIMFNNSPFAPRDVLLHPVQLYESAGNLFILAILFVFSKYSHKKGNTFALYMILYGVQRYILEFFRNDSRGAVGFFSTSQFISIFILLWGILIFTGFFKKINILHHSFKKQV
jgi:phosphatidylglycerol:prolipoprotein diacylglycerol transferase